MLGVDILASQLKINPSKPKKISPTHLYWYWYWLIQSEIVSDL
jgi:hypothetical protein